MRDVVDSIKNKLPIIESTTPVAIYNGGELTYMKLVGYNLKPNDVFDDADHIEDRKSVV